MNNRIISLLVCLAVVVLAFFAGLFYQKYADDKTVSSLQEKNSKLTEILGSGFVTSSVRGYIKDISGRTLSIYFGSFNLEVPIKENAKVSAWKAGSSSTRNISFSSLKADDLVTIFLTLDASGNLQGDSLFISE